MKLCWQNWVFNFSVMLKVIFWYWLISIKFFGWISWQSSNKFYLLPKTQEFFHTFIWYSRAQKTQAALSEFGDNTGKAFASFGNTVSTKISEMKWVLFMKEIINFNSNYKKNKPFYKHLLFYNRLWYFNSDTNHFSVSESHCLGPWLFVLVISR